jgi:putative nucleotidyltransferase with HDIG domain
VVSAETSTKIRDAVDIPTLPATLSRIQEVMRQPDSGVAEVAEIVAEDPPVAARVLQLANTAYYAPREEISSIQHAAAVLGMSVLESLVLQATLSEAFSGADSHTIDELWKHSVLVARTTQTLVERYVGPTELALDAQEFYTCGLLHDIGEFILLGSLGRRYLELLETSSAEHRESYYQEKREFGYTHTEVGAVMAHLWRFPQAIVEAIECHHLSRVRLRMLPHVSIVAFADQAADLIQSRALRSRATPDLTLLRDAKVPVTQVEDILRFADRCSKELEA